MLVFGDRAREVAPATMLAELAAALEAAARTRGIARHGWLVEGLIETGALAQGIADHAFAERGDLDDLAPAADAALMATRRIARLVARSWRSGFRDRTAMDAGSVLADLARLPLPQLIRVRAPEGFAHYCVYPEGYMEAARTLPSDRPISVVGIRTIGTTLAAMVAESVAELSGATTLRPVGHPFERTIGAGPDLRRHLARQSESRFAIVDEGPGLSGSSIAAVAQLLAALGIPDERVHVLPSHAGEPGPKASDATRRAWSRAPRHLVTFDDLVLRAGEPAHRLETWCADLVGEPRAPRVDISGGAWRRLKWAEEADWPPSHPWQERRKFLFTTDAGSFLLKFAGLGRAGRRKVDLARELFGAGFVPEPMGFRHGFLIERWVEPVDGLRCGPARAGLVARLGDYLGFRARTFPAEPGEGASVDTLFAMLRHNAGEIGLAVEPGRWAAKLGELERRRRPVLTDNRLHVWEWLDSGDALLKADAVDHHASHDLVGPQDVAWDIAGATIEFDLSPAEQVALMERTERTGVRIDAELLGLMIPCYLAFHLGSYTMASQGSAQGLESARLAAAACRYGDRLRQCLQAN